MHMLMQAAMPGGPVPPPTASRGDLRRWPRGTVLVRRWPGDAPTAQYFRRLDAALPLAAGAGGQFYEEDELAAAATAGWAKLPLLTLNG